MDEEGEPLSNGIIAQELEQSLNVELVNSAVSTNYSSLLAASNLADEKYLEIIKSIAQNHRAIKDIVSIFMDINDEMYNLIQDLVNDLTKIVQEFVNKGIYEKIENGDMITNLPLYEPYVV